MSKLALMISSYSWGAGIIWASFWLGGGSLFTEACGYTAIISQVIGVICSWIAWEVFND